MELELPMLFVGRCSFVAFNHHEGDQASRRRFMVCYPSGDKSSKHLMIPSLQFEKVPWFHGRAATVEQVEWTLRKPKTLIRRCGDRSNLGSTKADV